MSPVGLGTKNHCASECQQQFSSQEPFNTETEEPALLETFARQWLMKTNWELACAIVNFKGSDLAMALKFFIVTI
jgi:hypothetical protein